MAYPEGAIVHHGDCNVFAVMPKVCSCGKDICCEGECTCGLLHDLLPLTPDEIQEIKKIVPFGVIKGFRDYDIEPETEKERVWAEKWKEWIEASSKKFSKESALKKRGNVTPKEMEEIREEENKIELLRKQCEKLGKEADEEQRKMIDYDSFNHRFSERMSKEQRDKILNKKG